MKLADEVALLKAGGPGSGRHPEGGLSESPKSALSDPATMTPAQINKELDKLGKESSHVNALLISDGRGNERPSEIRTKGDQLSLRWKANTDRMSILHQEIATRYGPNAPYRMPTGFKRRK